MIHDQTQPSKQQQATVTTTSAALYSGSKPRNGSFILPIAHSDDCSTVAPMTLTRTLDPAWILTAPPTGPPAAPPPDKEDDDEAEEERREE